jgi:hypothetical protein
VAPAGKSIAVLQNSLVLPEISNKEAQ